MDSSEGYCSTSFPLEHRMKEVKFTKQTSIVALVFFIAYFFYGMFRLPFTQYLVSLAVGGIVYGITDSYELATVGLLVSNFLFPLVRGKEGFEVKRTEGYMDISASAAEISRRVGSMKQGVAPPIVGVGSPMSEGFEGTGAVDHTLDPKIPSENSTPVTATSTPAPVASAPAPAPVVASAPAAAPPSNALPPVHQPPAPETFQDSGGLFKLGQIPTDQKGGFHIDAGTTVINALNALKPDQIAAMTKDTKQLIDTQKSLMNMLQTFSPMVNEGKQMMETFNSMFSPAMGSLQTAQGMLQAGK